MIGNVSGLTPKWIPTPEVTCHQHQFGIDLPSQVFYKTGRWHPFPLIQTWQVFESPDYDRFLPFISPTRYEQYANHNSC